MKVLNTEGVELNLCNYNNRLLGVFACLWVCPCVRVSVCVYVCVQAMENLKLIRYIYGRKFLANRSNQTRNTGKVIIFIYITASVQVLLVLFITRIKFTFGMKNSNSPLVSLFDSNSIRYYIFPICFSILIAF